MNKAAPKEPSMDEILSSIRQIIADDDVTMPSAAPIQATAAKRPEIATNADFDMGDLPSFKPQGEPAGGRFPIVPPTPKPAPVAKTSLADVLGTLSAAVERTAPEPVEDEPLALSSAQIVVDEPEVEAVEASEPFSFASILADEAPAEEVEAVTASIVDPEDVAFAPEPEIEALPDFAPAPYTPEPVEVPEFQPAPRMSQTTSMPDPKLSADIAEQLIEPATSAAVRHTFSKLSGLNVSGQGTTLDSMMADMLRPMLKEWLDENLPSVVERMVEKEISRISRGLD